MNSLVNLNCETHYQSDQLLSDNQIADYLNQVDHWQVANSNNIKQLERTFVFKKYLSAVEFTKQVAQMAEAQNHHPEIVLSYGKVKVSWWTHAVKGLHLNDFICAAKTEKLFNLNSV